MNDKVITIEGLADFQADFEKGVEGIQGEINTAMVDSINTIKNMAQDIAPYKTGNLKRSIYTDIQNNGFMGIVGQDSNMAIYGSMVEFGTSPHVILPVNKRALYWQGAMYPVRRVNHPGTAPHPYMQPAFDNNIEWVQQRFIKAMFNIISTMAGKG